MIAAPSDDTATVQMIQRSFARGLSANHCPDHAKKTRLLPEQFTNSPPKLSFKKGLLFFETKTNPKKGFALKGFNTFAYSVTTTRSSYTLYGAELVLIWCVSAACCSVIQCSFTTN